jgi:hypothetical protein
MRLRRDDPERDEAVDARMVSVGDEGWAAEPPSCAEPDLGGELVAEEADDTGGGKRSARCESSCGSMSQRTVS